MGRPVSEFASASCPLRISQIPKFMRCSMSLLFDVDESERGVASQTGTALHALVEQYHRSNDLTKVLGLINDYKSKFPSANLDECERMLTAYANDRRNNEGNVITIEEEIGIEIETPKGPNIVLTGHIDQIRRIDGRLCVWDIKTSKLSGSQILFDYAYQLALYAFAATHFYGEPVGVGGVILPRKYLEKKNQGLESPDEVFFHSTLSNSDIETMVYLVFEKIQRFRELSFDLMPSVFCDWCGAKTPVVCLNKYRAIKGF